MKLCSVSAAGQYFPYLFVRYVRQNLSARPPHSTLIFTACEAGFDRLGGFFRARGPQVVAGRNFHALANRRPNHIGARVWISLRMPRNRPGPVSAALCRPRLCGPSGPLLARPVERSFEHEQGTRHACGGFCLRLFSRACGERKKGKWHIALCARYVPLRHA